MEQTFLNGIKIKKVRHLENISIPLSEGKRKHLILTGKNGSGKTSVIEALVKHFQFIISEQYDSEESIAKNYERREQKVQDLMKASGSERNKIELHEAQKYLVLWNELLENWRKGAVSDCNSFAILREKYHRGSFILAYYKDERKFQVEQYKNIEKVELEKNYKIDATPGQKLTKYLVDLKATQAFAKNTEKSKKIDEWFERFESVLKKIFEDPELKLEFNEDTFQFLIRESGHEPFDFNTMSSGYAAVLDIINDLIMRMEAQTKLRTEFDMEGIVLIDEIETHLHLELQKKILPILTELFPNLQFIITTHSPFILNSLDNAVIYDLEKRMLVPQGMGNLPYEGIVEGYFGADRLSEELRSKFERYKVLVNKGNLTDKEYAEIEELEYYLDEIPDYLATEVTTEYNRLKLEFANRGQAYGEN